MTRVAWRVATAGGLSSFRPAPLATRAIHLAPGERFGPTRFTEYGFHDREVALLVPIATPQGSSLRIGNEQVDVQPGEVHWLDVARGIYIDNPTQERRHDVLCTVPTTHPLALTVQQGCVRAEQPPPAWECRARRALRSLPNAVQGRVEATGRPVLSAIRSAQVLSQLEELQHLQVCGAEIDADIFAPSAEADSISAWLAPTAPPNKVHLAPTQLRHALQSARGRGSLSLALLPRVASQLLPKGFLRAPGSISVRVPTKDALNRWSAGEAPLGKYRRRSERVGVQVDICHSAEALQRAHFDFYRPFLARRFGSAANPHAFRAYELYDWEVLSARIGDRWVAAGTALLHHDRYRFLCLAYEKGQEAAAHALYAGALRRAAALGLPLIDLGPERPFLGDNVLSYKRQWGASLAPDPWRTHTLGIGYAERSAGLDALLTRSPLLVGTGPCFTMLTPQPSEAAARFRDWCAFKARPPPRVC